METKKIYTIIVDTTEDGNQMTRTNDGFNAFELLGILEMAQDDILKQMKNIEEKGIDIIKRQVVKENYFIFELLFFVLMFVIIGLLIQQNYKMTKKQKQDTFVVIEKSKKMEMNRCEYKLQNSQGKIIIYNEEFDNYKLGDTIKF